MLSFGKFLLVGVVVLAVAAYTRQKKAERARAEARRRPAVAAELDRCPICGVYHAAGEPHTCEDDDGSTRRKS